MNKIRLVIDIAMFCLTFFLMDVNFISPLWHEIFGIGIGFLIVFHLIFNLKWIKNITKNFRRVKSKTKMLYVVDILTFLSYLVTIVIGILISISIFNFETSYNPYLMLAHHMTGRLSLSLMLVHIGFHFNTIVTKLTKNQMVSIIIIMHLIYTLVKSHIWQSLIL